MPHVRPWRIATVALVATASLLLSRSSLLESLTDGLEEEMRPAPARLQRLHTPTIVESNSDWLDGKSSPMPDPTTEAHQVQGHALLYLLQPTPADRGGNATDATEIPATANSATNAAEENRLRLQR